MYDIEDYYEADTVADACDLLQKHPGAILICGGSDVLIRIREGKLAGSSLISIRGIRDLHGVSMEKDGINFHRSCCHLSSFDRGPGDPSIYPGAFRGGRSGRRSPDPQYRHHRRKSLQSEPSAQTVHLPVFVWMPG